MPIPVVKIIRHSIRFIFVKRYTVRDILIVQRNNRLKGTVAFAIMLSYGCQLLYGIPDL